jgi:hypothetical protein
VTWKVEVKGSEAGKNELSGLSPVLISKGRASPRL